MQCNSSSVLQKNRLPGDSPLHYFLCTRYVGEEWRAETAHREMAVRSVITPSLWNDCRHYTAIYAYKKKYITRIDLKLRVRMTKISLRHRISWWRDNQPGECPAQHRFFPSTPGLDCLVTWSGFMILGRQLSCDPTAGTLLTCVLHCSNQVLLFCRSVLFMLLWWHFNLDWRGGWRSLLPTLVMCTSSRHGRALTVGMESPFQLAPLLHFPLFVLRLVITCNQTVCLRMHRLLRALQQCREVQRTQTARSQWRHTRPLYSHTATVHATEVQFLKYLVFYKGCYFFSFHKVNRMVCLSLPGVLKLCTLTLPDTGVYKPVPDVTSSAQMTSHGITSQPVRAKH